MKTKTTTTKRLMKILKTWFFFFNSCYCSFPCLVCSNVRSYSPAKSSYCWSDNLRVHETNRNRNIDDVTENVDNAAIKTIVKCFDFLVLSFFRAELLCLYPVEDVFDFHRVWNNTENAIKEPWQETVEFTITDQLRSLLHQIDSGEIWNVIQSEEPYESKLRTHFAS